MEHSNNPWESIPLSDYENHMKLDSVMQLQAMNEMMYGQFYRYPVATVMLPGVAGGNGLNHVNPDKISKVYGVDINESYLAECASRYPKLSNVFEPVCCDLHDENSTFPKSDSIIANLLIEYVGMNVSSKLFAACRQSMFPV